MRAPTGLGKPGKALWQAVVGTYELEPHHEIALASACRAADMIGRLEDLVSGSLTVTGSMGQERLNPAVTELRQYRLALSRLLLDLALPADVSDPPATATPSADRPSPTSRRATKAANVRWRREQLREAAS